MSMAGKYWIIKLIPEDVMRPIKFQLKSELNKKLFQLWQDQGDTLVEDKREKKHSWLIGWVEEVTSNALTQDANSCNSQFMQFLSIFVLAGRSFPWQTQCPHCERAKNRIRDIILYFLCELFDENFIRHMENAQKNRFFPHQFSQDDTWGRRD